MCFILPIFNICKVEITKDFFKFLNKLPNLIELIKCIPLTSKFMCYYNIKGLSNFEYNTLLFPNSWKYKLRILFNIKINDWEFSECEVDEESIPENLSICSKMKINHLSWTYFDQYNHLKLLYSILELPSVLENLKSINLNLPSLSVLKEVLRLWIKMTKIKNAKFTYQDVDWCPQEVNKLIKEFIMKSDAFPVIYHRPDSYQ